MENKEGQEKLLRRVKNKNASEMVCSLKKEKEVAQKVLVEINLSLGWKVTWSPCKSACSTQEPRHICLQENREARPTEKHFKRGQPRKYPLPPVKEQVRSLGTTLHAPHLDNDRKHLTEAPSTQ